MSMKQPYNINVAADVAAQAALLHADKIMTTQVAALLRERNRMADEMAALGWLIPIPTDSNFVLFQVCTAAVVPTTHPTAYTRTHTHTILVHVSKRSRRALALQHFDG